MVTERQASGPSAPERPTMRALTIGEAGALVIADRPFSAPDGEEVLVRVAGAGLNRADLLQRAGLYPAPPGAPADVPGLEFAGVVEDSGPLVAGLKRGDRVFGILGGGGQAELVLTLECHCARVPTGIGLVAAGGIPEVFMTAHDALVTQAGLRPGERVLVNAVGSGVGLAAVQLATALGATVVGTARTAEKLARAEELGLHHAVLAPRELDPKALAQKVIAAGGAVDVVLDLVGGPYLGVDVAAAAQGGRIMIIGTMAGGRAELDLLGAMAKRLCLRGTTLRRRNAEEKAAVTRAFVDQVLPLLDSGAIQPVAPVVTPFEEAERAYALLASDATFGKVVLAVNEGLEA